MIIDCENRIFPLCEKILSVVEYEVYAYKNVIEALNDLRRRPDSFDFVIMALETPFYDVWPVAKEIGKIQSNTPVIMLQDNIQDMCSNMDGHQKLNAVIYKPLCFTSLRCTLKEILNRAKNGDGNE